MIAPASRHQPISAPVFSCWSRVTAARSSADLAGRQVHHLPAGHAGRAGGAGELDDQLGADEGILVRRLVGEDLEGQSVQRIAGEDRGAFVEGAVQSRLAAPQIVIVHARQIVVDQRIDVDALDRERRPASPASRSTLNRSQAATTSNGRIRLPPPIAA